MRKELLLDVAFEEFAKSGYKTTLAQIATRAGIKQQSIYNYFEGKDDLLYETIAREIQSYYSARMSELHASDGLKTEERLKTLFFSICDYYKDVNKLRFWRWILLIDSAEFFQRTRDLIRESEREFYISFKDIVQDGMKNSDASEKDIFAAVQVFAASLQGIMDGMLLYQEIYDPQILIDNVWNFYWMSIERYIEDERF